MRPAGKGRNLGAALLAGLVCGGLWVLFAITILDVVRPGVLTVLTVGLHALAMPVAAAISFGATGIWPPPETADLGLSVDLFGVRLVGTPTTVRLGVGGFVLGLLLVVIGDRALGRRGVPDQMRRGTGRLPR